MNTNIKSQGQVNSPLLALIEAAINQNLDVEKLSKVLELQTQWENKESRKSYFTALSGFQSELPIIKKTKTAKFPTRNGGTMEYCYASLDDICEQIKPLLQKHGLSYRFEQHTENMAIHIRCIVTHSDGHSEHCTMNGQPDTSGNKNNLQQMASAVTYLRRYAIEGAFGIATAAQDIDGRLPTASTAPQQPHNNDMVEPQAMKAFTAEPQAMKKAFTQAVEAQQVSLTASQPAEKFECASSKQITTLRSRISSLGLSDSAILEHFNIQDWGQLAKNQVKEVSSYARSIA
ncbi:MAG: ERF family protein [Cycloclasticus sp.]